jgi:excisionase family DNA binding protein
MQTPIVDREWLTREEVCDLLQIGPTKLWQLQTSGELPVSRIGRLVRIHREDVDAFMRRNREGVPR